MSLRVLAEKREFEKIAFGFEPLCCKISVQNESFVSNSACYRSTKINKKLKDYGSKAITVSDNGCGVTQENHKTWHFSFFC